MHKAANVVAPETSGARKVLAGRREELALTPDPAATVRKAIPALPTEIHRMLASLDRASLAGMRDADLILLGYATAACSSELTALNIGDVAEIAEGMVVTVYQRKIKKHTETAVPYGSNPATRPVRATRTLVAALAEHDRTSGPLLLRIDRHGRLAPLICRGGTTIGDPEGRMTAGAVADVVTRLAQTADLSGDWSGHSLRRGFANAARRQGHALERIGRHGGWADGSNLRVRSSGIVHEVTMTHWFADERMPGPACMVGVSGWDPGTAHPDRGPVTYRRCLKLTGHEPLGEQLELFGSDDQDAPQAAERPRLDLLATGR